MRISRTGISSLFQFKSIGRERGFTTIELMVVMVIIIIMSSVVAVEMKPAITEARLSSACREIMSTLAYARSYAITNRTNTRVVFDDRENSIVVQYQAIDNDGGAEMIDLTTQSGRFRRMNSKIAVVGIEKSSTGVEDRAVNFTQFGRGEDAVITLKDQSGKHRQILLDSITGRCRIKVGE